MADLTKWNIVLDNDDGEPDLLLESGLSLEQAETYMTRYGADYIYMTEQEDE
jgi:hypothetical protein